MSDQMKVKATKPGVYGGALRQAGDVFLVDRDQFSKRWMEEEKASPVQSHDPEQEKAYRENAAAAIEDLGNALAGNPSAAGADGMSDADFAAYYEQVMGKKPGRAKRETLQKELTDKLNAD